MVVVIKIPNPLLKNLFHYNADLFGVSCDFGPWSGFPLRVGEIFVDARCDFPLLEP